MSPQIRCPSEAFEQVLTDIRSHLGAWSPLFRRFLTLLEQLCSETDVRSADETILDIARVLIEYPVALYQLNPLFGLYDIRLEFNVRASPITALVLKTSTTSRIATLDPAYNLHYGFDNLSSSQLRDILALRPAEDPIYVYLHSTSDPILQACLAQLAQDVLDEGDLPRGHQKELLKFLRRPGGVPPSLLLYHLEQLDLLTCTGLSDIYNGTLAGRRVVIKKPRFRKDLLGNSEIIRELMLCRQFRHVNIVPFLGASFDEKSCRFGLVTPLMKYGNIMEFLDRYPATERLTPIWQIMNGLEYLHEGFDFPVAHRDIKGANILVNANLICCLSDFGLSSIPELSQRSRDLDPIGTYPWMAPEILEPPEQDKVDLLKADIYSLGATIYEIYTGGPPLANCRFPAIFKARVTLKEKPLLPPPCLHPSPEFLWKLVEIMWDDDPSKRHCIRMIRQGFEDSFAFPKQIKIDNGRQSCDAESHHIPSDKFIRAIVQRWLRREQAERLITVPRSVPVYQSLEIAIRDRTNHQTSRVDNTTLLRRATRRATTQFTRAMSPLSSDLEVFRGLATPVTPTMRASVPLSPAIVPRTLDQNADNGPLQPSTSIQMTPDPLTPPASPRTTSTILQPHPMRPPSLEAYRPRDPARLIIPREDILRPGSIIPPPLNICESEGSSTPLSPGTPKRGRLSCSGSGDRDEQENVIPSRVQKFQEEQGLRDLRSPSPSKRRRTHDDSSGPSSPVSARTAC